MAEIVLGVFVGGQARRMGGQPKGLLLVPGTGETIVGKLVRIGAELGFEVVLVGEGDGYHEVAPGLTRLPDAISGVGPLGGLLALLRYSGLRRAIAIGCDMPFITAQSLHGLAEHPAQTNIVAPGDDRGWEPLLSRYEPAPVLPVLERAIGDGIRSFQKLFSRLTVTRFDVSPEVLVDWDTPRDVLASRLPT